MPTDYLWAITRPHRAVGSVLLVTSALLLAAGALLLSGFVAGGAAEDGRTTLSSSDILVGGTEPTSVLGEGYTSCAGREVTVSLIFPVLGVPAGAPNPFDSAPRINPQRATIDASGRFSVGLPAPPAFPGAWIGYVALEGDCVTTGKQRLLAEVRVGVRLGSSEATALGIQATGGSVVVIPARAITGYPILPGEPEKDPYKHFTPIVLRNAAGTVCTSAGQPARNGGGDLIVAVADGACPEGETTVAVGPRGTALLSLASVRPGYAVGLQVTWPPPSSGNEVPGAPATGTGSRTKAQGGEVAWLPFGLVAAGAGALALSAGRRRVRRG